MENLFIQVFSKEDKNLLLSKGYALIKEDPGVYTFSNCPSLSFADLNIQYVFTDTLSL